MPQARLQSESRTRGEAVQSSAVQCGRYPSSARTVAANLLHYLTSPRVAFPTAPCPHAADGNCVLRGCCARLRTTSSAARLHSHTHTWCATTPAPAREHSTRFHLDRVCQRARTRSPLHTRAAQKQPRCFPTSRRTRSTRSPT
jgi:hypothetical protein